MPSAAVVVSSDVERTPRVLQAEGIFDVPPSRRVELRWDVELPLDERPWNVGLIVGPSGSGKSTVARSLWPEQLAAVYAWPEYKSLLDGFPASLSIKEIVALLNAVGFSSPPAWVRPFAVLSTGEQFRVSMARLLAEQPDLTVVDEFSSVVDRTVAQIGSAALAKTVRQRGQQFVAVTCHSDVEAWLDPDWVYQPAINHFAWRSLQRRPPIDLRLTRCHHSAWPMFRQHHYLDSKLNVAARCFVAYWGERLVAFSSWLPMPSGTLQHARREHRTVCLPDYQGVGIGNAVSDTLASAYKALGYVPISTTAQPAMIRSRSRSSHWRMHRAPGTQLNAGNARPKTAGRAWHEKDIRRSVAATRITAGFRYVGPAMECEQARCLLGEMSHA